MRVIELDSIRWKTAADFYADLVAVLGAPEGHARNVNALLELMIWDRDAAISPYTIRVSRVREVSEEVRNEMTFLQRVLGEARAESIARRGFDVEVNFEMAWD